jgi:class 3 adenylate cyclase
MAEAIEGRGGRIVTMAGDGLTAVFAAPPAGLASATAAAEDLRVMATELNREHAAAGRVPIMPVVGIASGELSTGSVATALRMVPVCLGPAAARALALAAEDGAEGSIRVVNDTVSGRPR